MKAKPKRGRPKSDEADKKSKPVQMRMTDLEKEGFIAAAELAGLSLSAWMRERLRIAARDELAKMGKRVPFIS
jgi:hypothetical protein